MRSPSITLLCDCGAEGSTAYGQRWTCPECDRVYDTSQIPAADYARLDSLNTRYRLASWAIVTCLALLLLSAAITQQLMPTVAGLGVVLVGWFLFIKPMIHRRHRRAVGNLKRKWELKAE